MVFKYTATMTLSSIDTQPVVAGAHVAYQRVCQPIAGNMQVAVVGANDYSPLH